jgi:hypothetical protein
MHARIQAPTTLKTWNCTPVWTGNIVTCNYVSTGSVIYTRTVDSNKVIHGFQRVRRCGAHMVRIDQRQQVPAARLEWHRVGMGQAQIMVVERVQPLRLLQCHGSPRPGVQVTRRLLSSSAEWSANRFDHEFGQKHALMPCIGDDGREHNDPKGDVRM